MDITKVVLTFVIVYAILVITMILYVNIQLSDINFNLKILQSKHDTNRLQTSLCLRRLNHERYKEPRVTGPQGKN